MTRAALVGMLVLALAGCGCGDGNDSGSSRTAPAATDGKALFAESSCGNCHRLADAGTAGQVGPDLDDLELDTAAVERQIARGGGGMPAFADSLSEEQIAELARYVTRVAGR